LPREHRYAFEFRNATWSVPETYDLLARHNIAYCIFHLSGIHSPIQVTADFTYVRLHGPGGKYQGSYTDAALRKWAERIAKWRRELKAIYADPRIAKTIDYVKAYKPAQFDGAETRDVTFPVGPSNLTLKGQQFLSSFSFPNFYFHAATAHGILRHNGVEIGKRDFLGVR